MLVFFFFAHLFGVSSDHTGAFDFYQNKEKKKKVQKLLSITLNKPYGNNGYPQVNMST